jgi:hypothetical protein
MSIVSRISSRRLQGCGVLHFNRLTAISAFSALITACGAGSNGADQAARAEAGLQQTAPQQATLPPTLCDLLPQADAEKIMGKALVEHRNDEWACHYQDAQGTTGTGLMVDFNVIDISDQCRVTPGSEPLSGVGSTACIAIGLPVGIYTTLAFGAGGRTFVVTAPGEDKASELATPVARVILSKLGSAM